MKITRPECQCTCQHCAGSSWGDLLRWYGTVHETVCLAPLPAGDYRCHTFLDVTDDLYTVQLSALENWLVPRHQSSSSDAHAIQHSDESMEHETSKFLGLLLWENRKEHLRTSAMPRWLHRVAGYRNTWSMPPPPDLKIIGPKYWGGPFSDRDQNSRWQSQRNDGQ